MFFLSAYVFLKVGARDKLYVSETDHIFKKDRTFAVMEMYMKQRICKWLAALVCFVQIAGVCTVPASAAQGKSWYVPRSGQTQPTLPAELTDALPYGAYYMNTAKCDKDDDRVLYLTFDAGYENGNVEKILDVLKEEHVPAAFFILGHLCLKNTDLVKRMKDEGHLVCNHTKNHKDLTGCSREEIADNLTDLERVFEETTGYTMDKYFRFPEGRYSTQALQCVQELGYKTIFWSFGYEDWDNEKQPDPEKSKEKILSRTHNGAVILLHPTSATNAAIMRDLIRAWKDLGYRFGTLDELVAP